MSQRKNLRQLLAMMTLAIAGTAGTAAMAAPGMMPLGGHGMSRMLDEVKASPDQRAQIEQITQSARADLQAQHEAGRSLHEQSLQLFAQPAVDAAAAEALRQQMLAQHDRASQRTMQAMLEISRVLTPEQRQLMSQKMAVQMKQRGERMPHAPGMHPQRHGQPAERKSS